MRYVVQKMDAKAEIHATIFLTDIERRTRSTKSALAGVGCHGIAFHTKITRSGHRRLQPHDSNRKFAPERYVRFPSPAHQSPPEPMFATALRRGGRDVSVVSRWRRFGSENTKQRLINVVIAAPELSFTQHAIFCEFIQIARGRKPRDLQIVLDKFNFGVREREEVVDEILAVKLMSRANTMFVVQAIAGPS